MIRLTLSMLLVLCCSLTAHAEVRTETIEYGDGDVQLAGFMAWDDAIQGRRPGVLVVHEWWGLNDYARDRARQLAELGYVAFALDMYGKNKTTEHPQEASQWASQIRANVDAWRQRALAGLKILRQHDKVDPQQVAAIGYCFGGSTVLQLAYSDAQLRGVVSFHGALTPPGEDQEKISTKILVCHGAADPFISAEQASEFREALSEIGADWHMVYFGGAKHSFTNPDADRRGIDGLAYDREADFRSWAHMRLFFDELFAK